MTCQVCGLSDALDRHTPECSYARSMGLPFLADGELPIPPEEGFPVPSDPPPRPDDLPVAPLIEAAVVASRQPQGLWLAHNSDLSDLVIYDSELEALRYAVANAMFVRRVKLGVSLGDQIREAAENEA